MRIHRWEDLRTARKFDQLRKLLDDVHRVFIFSSSMWPIWSSEPYQEIIHLGPAVLPLLLERIRAGEFTFNYAYMSITGITLDQLTNERFVSEQEISRLILERHDGVNSVA